MRNYYRNAYIFLLLTFLMAEYFFLGLALSACLFWSTFCSSSSVIWGLKGSLKRVNGGFLGVNRVRVDFSDSWDGDDTALDLELDLVTLWGVDSSCVLIACIAGLIQNFSAALLELSPTDVPSIRSSLNSLRFWLK